MSEPPRFQAGGSLHRGALYVERPADQELPAALAAGEFCYVLAPRQIGKSSLRVRAQQRLTQAGVRCVTLDLTRIGGRDATVEQWYFGLLDDTTVQLGIPSAAPFWHTHPLLSPVQRWGRYLRHLLSLIDQNLVVFIDEIDTVLSQPTSARDDFFAAIRALYNARADDPAYLRLTFCLIGVAMPDDLIQDQNRTPFNIGRGIALEDFTAAQARAFLPGLRAAGEDPERLLAAILEWTDGHPCMTQRLCQALLEQPDAQATGAERERVDELVQRVYLCRRGIGLEQHPMPAFSRPRQGDPRIARLLRLYGRILAREVVRADPLDPLQIELRLTGMAAYRATPKGALVLRTRNRVFAEVYDQAWVMARESRRLLSDAADAWEAAGKREEFLLQGAPLTHAQEWTRGREDVSSSEREFLIMSLDAARRREEELRRAESVLRQAELRHQETQALHARRNYLILSAMIGVLVLTGLWQRERWLRAQEEQRLAQMESQEQKAQRKQAEVERQEEADRRTLAERRSQLDQREKKFAEEKSRLAQASAAEEARRALLATETAKAKEMALAQAALIDRGSQIRIAVLETGHLMQGLRDVLTMAAPHAGELAALPLAAREAMAAAAAATALVSFPAAELAAGPDMPVAFSPDGGRLLAGTPQGTWFYDGATGARLHPLPGPLRAAAFSQDGRRAATADTDDGPVTVWDAERGRPLATLGRLGRLRQPALSPDGALLAAFGDEEDFWVWDVAARRHAAPPLRHGAPIKWAGFAPSGQQIVTATVNHEVHIFDVRSGAKLPVSLPHHAEVNDLRFSADGAHLFTASEDGHIRAYEVRTGRQRFDLNDHAASVVAVAASADSRLVASLSLDRTARIWDAGRGRLPTMLQAGAPLRATAFRGGELLAGGDDHLVRLWDPDTGRLLRVLEGHAAPILAISVAPSQRHVHTLAGNTNGCSLLRWDLGAPRPLSIFAGHRGAVRAAARSGSGAHLLTVGEDRIARFWDARTGALLRPLPHEEEPRLGALASDGGRALTAPGEGAALLWDTGAGVVAQRLGGHQGRLCAVAFSPDGSAALTADPGRVRLWDLRGPGGVTVRWEAEIAGDREDPVPAGLGCALFTRDGRRVLARSSDAAVLYDAATGARVAVLGGHTDRVTAVAEGGQMIATAGLDGMIRIWSTDTGTLRRSISCGGPVLSMALAPRGDVLVARALDMRERRHMARRFDPRTGQEGGWRVAPGPQLHGDTPRPRIEREVAEVRVVAISPDGERVALGKEDGWVSLWSARSGQLLYRLRAHEAAVTSAAFAVDGKALTTASEDGVARLLPASLEASLAIARQLCGSNASRCR